MSEARRLFILVVHVCDIMIYVRRNAQAVRYVLTKMVKFGCPRFYFL